LESFVESSVAVLDGGRYLVREGAYELSGRFLIFERRGETYSRWKSVEFGSTKDALRYLAETLVSEADAREEYEREAPKFWAGLADSFESLGSTDFADAMRRFAGVATSDDLAVVEDAYEKRAESIERARTEILDAAIGAGGDPDAICESDVEEAARAAVDAGLYSCSGGLDAEEAFEREDARRHMNDEEVVEVRAEIARDLGVDPESLDPEDVRDAMAVSTRLRTNRS
jgi:hypothetical protein